MTEKYKNFINNKWVDPVTEKYFESTSPDKILDGELDDFLEQSLYKIK